MKIPQVFIKYRMPLDKADYLNRYWLRRDQNLQERWTIRNLVRMIRDIDFTSNHTVEEDPFVAIFGRRV